MLPLNANEPQPPVRLTAGQARLTLKPPTVARWDFERSQFRSPSWTEVEPLVEVHVTEQETGGHGFATVPFAPV